MRILPNLNNMGHSGAWIAITLSKMRSLIQTFFDINRVTLSGSTDVKRDITEQYRHYPIVEFDIKIENNITYVSTYILYCCPSLILPNLI